MEPSLLLMLTMGLLGSAHCVGMCGSIAGALALSLPRECRDDPLCLARYIAIYNLGRLLTYAIAGAVGGALGAVLSGAEHLPMLHQGARWLASLVLIAAGLYLTGWLPQLSRMERIGEPLWRRIEPLGRRLLPLRRPSDALWFGLIWGWLPCGLVYYALLLTTSTEGPVQGAMHMALFGLGTLPAVGGVGLAAGWFTVLARNPRLKQIGGLVLVAAGLLSLIVPGAI